MANPQHFGFPKVTSLLWWKRSDRLQRDFGSSIITKHLSNAVLDSHISPSCKHQNWFGIKFQQCSMAHGSVFAFLLINFCTCIRLLHCLEAFPSHKCLLVNFYITKEVHKSAKNRGNNMKHSMLRKLLLQHSSSKYPCHVNEFRGYLWINVFFFFPLWRKIYKAKKKVLQNNMLG